MEVELHAGRRQDLQPFPLLPLLLRQEDALVPLLELLPLDGEVLLAGGGPHEDVAPGDRDRLPLGPDLGEVRAHEDRHAARHPDAEELPLRADDDHPGPLAEALQHPEVDGGAGADADLLGPGLGDVGEGPGILRGGLLYGGDRRGGSRGILCRGRCGRAAGRGGIVPRVEAGGGRRDRGGDERRREEDAIERELPCHERTLQGDGRLQRLSDTEGTGWSGHRAGGVTTALTG